jgi:hypothetical protein
LNIKNYQNTADCGWCDGYEGITSVSHCFPKQRPNTPLRYLFPCFWQSQTYRNGIPKLFGMPSYNTKVVYNPPKENNEIGLKILEVFLVILEK